MESNLRPSPYGDHFNRPPYRPHNPDYPPKPHMAEDTLKKETIQIERKTFTFTLRENERGRFLRITEDVNGRRDNIIIPASELAAFQKILLAMVQANGEIPSKTPRPG